MVSPFFDVVRPMTPYDIANVPLDAMVPRPGGVRGQ
jgi:hypothetical protein